MRKFHIDGSKPTKGEIFVFGSNLAGIHGAGAAKAALDYGAAWGCGFGRMGGAYAIPTKDATVRCSLSLEMINQFVSAFVDHTRAHPDERFFVTRVGCGLAGYEDADIAPMFRDAINCSFANSWKRYI